MKMSALFFKFLAVMLLTSSCKKDPKEEDSGTPTAGVVKGKVTDTQGRPLKGVTILIDNTLLYNSYLQGATGNDGTYQIKLYNSTWQAYAEMNVDYNGKTYKVDLHPDNSAGFSGEGAIRNFQWKLSGKKPAPLTGHYGGTIITDKYIMSEIYDSENIEFTLTPAGALIDGSAGQVIRMTHGQPATDTYGKLVDIPIGRYTVTAVYKSAAGNVLLKLRDKEHNRNGAFTTSLQLDFEPTTSIGNNMAVLEYNEQ